MSAASVPLTPCSLDAPRFVVVAPTYDNAGSLADVLERLAAMDLPVIVVDDGSNDATPEILAVWAAAAQPGRRALRHARNRGKADALFTAFREAARLGYTHAVTMDTDGQLDPADIPAVLDAAREVPAALVLGWRDDRAADYPARSRIGRRINNVLIRFSCGARICDSQCGLRVYELRSILALPRTGGCFEFESECIVRAVWAGLPIRQVAVSCRYDLPHHRVTHFRVVRDTLRAGILHARLLCRALLPWPPQRLHSVEDPTTGTIASRMLRWLSPARAWREVQAGGAGRRHFATGLALGVFIANLPIYGLQNLSAMLCAKWLRLHPLPVLAGAQVSTPPLGPVLIAAGIALGHRVLRGFWPQLADFRQRPPAELLRTTAAEWLVGGTLLGAALAILAFLGCLALLELMPRRQDAGGGH